jgi:hypothetical protein
MHVRILLASAVPEIKKSNLLTSHEIQNDSVIPRTLFDAAEVIMSVSHRPGVPQVLADSWTQRNIVDGS